MTDAIAAHIGQNHDGHLRAPAARSDLGGVTPPRFIAMLAGTLRPTAWTKSIGRPLIDLPVSADQNLLSYWHQQAVDLASGFGFDRLPLRVLTTKGAATPRTNPGSTTVPITVELDAAEFPGTGGVLRSLACEIDGEERMLIVNGNQVPLEPLADQFRRLVEVGGDLSICAHADGTPVGIMLAKGKMLAAIRETAFSDFKEQALPELAKKFDVRVVTRPAATGLPVRTRESYLGALRAMHRMPADGADAVSAFAEDWSSTFAVIEKGATVAPTARIHDSVVLSGATIGEGALVARSVVCSGARVSSGQTLVDALVAGGGRSRASTAAGGPAR